MPEPTYNIHAYAFIDGKPKELWDNIMSILDNNIKVETEIALSTTIEGEKRVHQCGRANAIREIKEVLVSERKKALDIANINWSDDPTLK